MSQRECLDPLEYKFDEGNLSTYRRVGEPGSKLYI